MVQEELCPLFMYSLVADGDGDLEAMRARLAEIIRQHSARHDFAQRIHLDGIEIRCRETNGKARMELLVPFHKEHFIELAVLNRYVMARAAECGMHVSALVLPGGDSVSFEAP